MSPLPPDPEDRDYLSYNWGSLAWSDWVPFNADREIFHTIPMEPGVYRIKPVGKDCLMYVGSTGQPLHTRLAELRQTLRRADLMPWSDPHPEAPALWVWWTEWLSDQEIEKKLRGDSNTDWLSTQEVENNLHDSSNPEWAPADEVGTAEDHQISSGTADDADASPTTSAPAEQEPVMLECSASPLDGSTLARKGMESFLVYRYRQERRESPLCNFGRFHPRYRKSTSRKEGRRGGKLEDSQKDNPAGFPSIEPLEVTAKPGEPDWMGLEWPAFLPLVPEKIAAIRPGAGLYLLADAATTEIVYIGQSADVGTKLLGHTKKSWDDRALVFSYQIIGEVVLPHNLRELENDLIGNFFEQNRRAPEFQFTKKH